MQIQVYLAAPLFTQAEWQWNQAFAHRLEAFGLRVFLPQAKAEPMLKRQAKFNPKKLFDANVKGIETANVIVAILDQPDPDSGTCWECGYAYKLGKPVLGVRTDIRQLSDAPKSSTNLMLDCSCYDFLKVPTARRDDIPWVAHRVAKSIRKLKGA